MRYYFESALATNVFWVDLKKIDFSENGGKVKRLDLGPQQRTIYSGEANAQFKDAKPFRFLGV
jgi:choloylglycine hydrolase